MSIDQQILSRLVCPLSGQALRLMSVEEKNEIPAQILPENFDAFLVTEDGRVAYPVQNNIASLLPEQRILLD